jgi:hypothetical protein
LPASVITTMVAIPGLTALTVPFVDTEAIAALLLLHFTFLFVALLGSIIGMRVSEPPKVRVKKYLLRDTLDTGTVPEDVTVTAQVAVLPPSSVLTIIVAVPGLTAVTIPFVDTEATAALLLLHVTFWFVALLGAIVGMRVSILPTTRLIDVLRETPVPEHLCLGTIIHNFVLY